MLIKSGKYPTLILEKSLFASHFISNDCFGTPYNWYFFLRTEIHLLLKNIPHNPCVNNLPTIIYAFWLAENEFNLSPNSVVNWDWQREMVKLVMQIAQ